MDSDPMIIVAVGLSDTVKLLIRSKLAPIEVDFRTPASVEELMQTLNTREFDVACVLVDSDHIEDKGQSALRAVRKVSKTVPAIMVSSETDKNYYVSAIRWGVTSFLVKPFKDEAVRGKLMECYRAQSEKNVEIITFNLERYLLGEFRKAEKGKYGISFMFATVTLDDPDEEGNVMSLGYYLNLLYETIRHLFWDTDAFIRLNSRYYLGVFPFCGERNIESLMKKVRKSFNALHVQKQMPAYVHLVTAFASYPDDGRNFLEVQRALADRVRMNVGDMKVDWFV